MRFAIPILFIASLWLSLNSCNKGCSAYLLQSFIDTSVNTTSTNTFTYTNGKPVRQEQVDSSYTIYHYNPAGLIDTVSKYDKAGLLVSYQVYTYSGKNFSSKMVYAINDGSGTLNLILQRQYVYTGDSITRLNETLYSGGKTTATYTVFSYSVGNISAAQKYNTATSALVYNRTYTYDKHPNPWGNFAAYVDYFSVNNMLSQLDAQDPTTNMSYTYQYNGEGYPASMTVSYSSVNKTESYNYGCP